MDRSKLNRVELDLVEGLEELNKHLAADEPLKKKFTLRRYEFAFAPGLYSPEDIRSVRSMLNASQSLFAKLLGVSTKTVCSWETGKQPSGMARRFMDEIKAQPDYWRNRIVSAVTVSKPGRKSKVD